MEAALNGPLGRTALGPLVLRLGRAADNTLVIQDQQASSHHAEVAPGFGGNGYQVTDLGSTNGTFVNEQRLTPNSPRALNSGDVIRIGKTSLTYEMSSGYAPTMAASAPSYEPTVAAAQPDFFAPPAIPQPPAAYGNFGTPAQAPYTPPPPVYPQPAYPQPQAAYPQDQYPSPQQGYPQAQPGGYPPPQQGYPQAQPGGYLPPQQGYPQPGGFGQPGLPPKKKGNPGLIIALVVILALVVGGGGFYYFQIRSTPQKTLAAYCDGWKTNNAQEIYDQLDTTQKSKGTVSQIQQSLTALQLLGGIKDCTVGSAQENGSSATGVVTITVSSGHTLNQTLTLIQENGTWKIDNGTSSPTS